MVVVGTTAVPFAATRAGDLDVAIGLVLKMNEAAAQSQKRVAKLDDQAGDLRAEYRSTQQQLMSLEEYNGQIAKLVAAQDEQIALLDKQLGEATEIGRGVTPLLSRMVDALEKFVELDVPFLLDERENRVEQLKKLLNRPDVTEAEKYRLITEAYQIENEYGRTLETYRGELPGEGEQTRTVEFLRVGRIALVYRTVDGEDLGAWNQQTREWEPLGPGYKTAVKKGFRIARKQAAPDLFPIPVFAPEERAQ